VTVKDFKLDVAQRCTVHVLSNRAAQSDAFRPALGAPTHSASGRER